MSILSNEQMQTTKQFIFQNGRLLERQLFEYFFGKGTKQACVRALLAYQNADGGFGNGIEPDLLCPDSTAIGAETAMYVMELLDYRDPEGIDPLLNWIVEHQNAAGFIPHPPASLFDYPYQPWWKNPDAERVLTLAGLLKKWGLQDDTFFRRVRGYYERAEMPSADNYYGYPYFVYLKYCGDPFIIRLQSFLESRWANSDCNSIAKSGFPTCEVGHSSGTWLQSTAAWKPF